MTHLEHNHDPPRRWRTSDPGTPSQRAGGVGCHAVHARQRFEGGAHTVHPRQPVRPPTPPPSQRATGVGCHAVHARQLFERGAHTVHPRQPVLPPTPPPRRGRGVGCHAVHARQLFRGWCPHCTPAATGTAPDPSSLVEGGGSGAHAVRARPLFRGWCPHCTPMAAGTATPPPCRGRGGAGATRYMRVNSSEGGAHTVHPRQPVRPPTPSPPCHVDPSAALGAWFVLGAPHSSLVPNSSSWPQTPHPCAWVAAPQTRRRTSKVPSACA